MSVAAPYYLVQMFSPPESRGVGGEYSTTSESNGQQIAQEAVECEVLPPDSQGIQIQQGVEQVVISQDELGKRNIREDLDLEERQLDFEERQLQLETLSIQNDKERAENRIAVVLKTCDAMTALEPLMERMVHLPGGQRVQIQQVVQHLADSGLGKRKNVCDLKNGQIIEETSLNAKTPWYINQITVGWIFRASLMKEMPAVHNLDATLLARIASADSVIKL